MKIEKIEDVRYLLSDKEITDEVVKKLVKDIDLVENLSDEIAKKVSKELKHDYTFRKNVIFAAVKNQEFKRLLINKIKIF